MYLLLPDSLLLTISFISFSEAETRSRWKFLLLLQHPEFLWEHRDLHPQGRADGGAAGDLRAAK